MRNLLLALFSHRLLAIARWDLHFLGVRLLNALTRRPSRVRAALAASRGKRFLNLGSGPRGSDDPRWLNIDGYRDRNVHLLADFAQPLPFDSATFDGVFCEHVLEHFSMADGERLCREVARVLKPGGCFRVVVPDAERIVRTYLDSPAELCARRGTGQAMTAMEVVNLYFRQRYEHQFLYDWETMASMLRRAGFADVVRTRHGEAARLAEIALDDPKYAWESLYVEAMVVGAAA